MNKQLQVVCCAISLLFAIHANAEEAATPLWTKLGQTTIGGYVDVSAHWNPGTGTPALSAMVGPTINGYTAVIPNWLPANSAPWFIRNHRAPLRAYGGLPGPTPNYTPIRNYGGMSSPRFTSGRQPVIPIPVAQPTTPRPNLPPRTVPQPIPVYPGGAYGSSASTTVVLPGIDYPELPGITRGQFADEPRLPGIWEGMDVPWNNGNPFSNERDRMRYDRTGVAPLGEFKAVPEPSTWALLALGGCAVGFAKLRRRK